MGLIIGSGIGGIANNTSFDNTGHQTMRGEGKPWRDEVSDAINLQQTGAGVSRNNTEATVDFTTGANLSDYMYGNIQLNHDKELTASIYPHVHWFQAQSGAPNFLFQHRWQAIGAQKVTAWTNVPCNALAFTYVSGTIHQLSYSNPIIPPSRSNISDIVQFRVVRDNLNNSVAFSGVDTYAATTAVTAVDIHFQIDSLGSTDQFLK